MKTMLSFILFIGFISNAYSGQIIWNYETIDNLSQTYLKNPIYLKRRILSDIKLERQDLGVALSPYYKIGNFIHKNYKSFLGQCYRTTQYKSKTYARKTKCANQKFYIIVDNVRYDLIDDLSAFYHNQIEFDHQAFQTSIEGFHHTKYDFDQDGSDQSPYSNINIELKSNKLLKVENNRVYIDTIVNQTRSKYAFLEPKEKLSKTQLRIEPVKGDMVFSNSDQTLILLKRYQPSVFRFKINEYNNLHTSYLDSIDDYLFTYKGAKRCFRDGWIEKSKYDCDALIFNKTSVIRQKDFSYIKVDFKMSEVLIK